MISCRGPGPARRGKRFTGMTTIDECDTEKFDTLDSYEKTIAILGDRWWPQAAKQEKGLRLSKVSITGGHS